VLAVLCLLGLGRLLWQREAALLVAAAGLATTTFILLIREQYAYGAYKVLALGWWIAAFVIVSGLAWLHDRLQRFAKQPWPMAAVLVPGLIVPAVTTARAYIETRDAPAERISDYRAIERLPDAIGDAPVALAAWDSNAAHWGAYFLRRANLFMAVRPGYLGAPHVAPLINAARQAPVDRIRYVILESSSGLARASGWRLVWGVGRLTVWDTAPVGWAVVTGVRDALGNDVLPSPYFHTGPPGAAVQVISSRSGMLTVSGRLFNALIPDDHSCWQLAMSGPGGAPAQELTLKAGTATLDTPIPAGRSTFELRAKTVVPTPFSAQDGRREAGFADLAARLRPPAPAGTDGVPGPPQAETPCHGS
jgi:hypothetical protein